MTRTRIYLAVAGAAAVLAAALIGASILTRGGNSRESSPARAAASLFDGIPQRGAALGREKAPVTIVEFADRQCPYCAAFSVDGLPPLVREYVGPARARIVFNGMAFIGPESDLALRAALAAGRQNRLWDVVERLYAQQGPENSGWVTDSSLRTMLAGIPGLDADRVLRELNATAVTRELRAADARAQRVRVPGTPYFLLGKTGGALQHVELQNLTDEIDRLLAR